MVAVSTYQDDQQMEREIQRRVEAALDLPAGSVGIIVGTNLVLVKVAREAPLTPIARKLILGALIAMGLGGNLYHILES
jgi:hypothetical protein